MLTKAESKSIESVQKTGLYLIYGAKFRSYTWALLEANMKTQVEQRRKLFEKFTKACGYRGFESDKIFADPVFGDDVVIGHCVY